MVAPSGLEGMLSLLELKYMGSNLQSVSMYIFFSFSFLQGTDTLSKKKKKKIVWKSPHNIARFIALSS